MHEKPFVGMDIIDFLQVQKLLMGRLETDQKKPRTVYLRANSEEEAAAFATLAGFLRRPDVPSTICLMLADLFDPQPNDRTARRFVFKKARGRPVDIAQRRAIADGIFMMHVDRGQPLVEVLAALSDAMCTDLETLEKLWYAERNAIAKSKGCPDVFSKKPVQPVKPPPLSDEIRKMLASHGIDLTGTTNAS